MSDIVYGICEASNSTDLIQAVAEKISELHGAWDTVRIISVSHSVVFRWEIDMWSALVTCEVSGTRVQEHRTEPTRLVDRVRAVQY
jgi:hypothetical protein